MLGHSEKELFHTCIAYESDLNWRFAYIERTLAHILLLVLVIINFRNYLHIHSRANGKKFHDTKINLKVIYLQPTPIGSIVKIHEYWRVMTSLASPMFLRLCAYFTYLGSRTMILKHAAPLPDWRKWSRHVKGILSWIFVQPSGILVHV